MGNALISNVGVQQRSSWTQSQGGVNTLGTQVVSTGYLIADGWYPDSVSVDRSDVDAQVINNAGTWKVAVIRRSGLGDVVVQIAVEFAK